MPDPAPESASSPGSAGVAELVRAAQAGDAGAYGVLYQRFGAFIHGVVLAYASLWQPIRM